MICYFELMWHPLRTWLCFVIWQNVKTHPLCDLFALETVHHLIMQCPEYIKIKTYMYEEIRNTQGCIYMKNVPVENLSSVSCCILGKPIQGMDMSDQIVLWCISGYAIMNCIVL